jgi:hypothetical protein
MLVAAGGGSGIEVPAPGTSAPAASGRTVRMFRHFGQRTFRPPAGTRRSSML